MIGAVSLTAFCRRPAKADDEPEMCEGHVYDPNGKGLDGIVVQIMDSHGGFASTDTGQDGQYSFRAPKTGTYVIAFVERKLSTHLHAVTQLTAGPRQILSVTIDSSSRTLVGIYNQLQAVETLCVAITGDREGALAEKIREKYPLNKMGEALGKLKFSGLSANEAQVLEIKRKCVLDLLAKASRAT